MARWNAFLLLLATDSVFHVRVLLNTQLLQILFELRESALHLSGCTDEFVIELGLVDVNLAILEVLLLRNVFTTRGLVLPPIRTTFLFPLLHELLILC